MNKNIKIVDLSGDLRLPASEYKQWYKKDPTSDEVINQAVYGLTEWNRDQVKTSHLISNPGCYPTATLLGLAPVVVEHLIEKINYHRCQIRHLWCRSLSIKVVKLR